MGLGSSLSLPPSKLGGIRCFCRSETPIFHCARGEEIKAKGSHWGDQTLDQMLNWTLDRT
jgi:hypothetical protein